MVTSKNLCHFSIRVSNYIWLLLQQWKKTLGRFHQAAWRSKFCEPYWDCWKPKALRQHPYEKQKYSTEIKTRAVEILIESQKDYPTLWAAIQAIAPKFGCSPITLRSWHQKHLAKQNPIAITTESQAARIAELERENRELKQANKIIRKAAAFFA